MKQSRFAGLLCSVALAAFLFSCGGSGNQTINTADSTATADSAAKAAAAAKALSSIVTTPQNMVIVTHKVKDYAKWLVGYEAHDSVRLAYGVHNYVIGRGLQDSNMVLVALKIDDIAKAKAFVKDPGLKKAMQKGGVVGPPSISFVTETWQDTATIDSKIRSRVSYTVKDWDAWMKVFVDGKQERTDNGVVDRVVGHDVDDNKKVSIVTALTDTAKAFAYYKSDALKKRREAGGATSAPDRFLFWITKRY
jgi:hypothetical protein